MEKFINEKGEYYNSFIYQWFDRNLNKFYIGSHYGEVNDGYLFGGIDIKKEYKETERSNDELIELRNQLKSLLNG